MPNEILTARQIAMEGLMRLKSTLIMPNLVNRDYSSEFKQKGDTIDVRVPATYVADEFGGTINLQDNIEGKVPVKMDIHADVSTEVTSQEMTLEINEFSDRFLSGMILAISEKVDKKIAENAARGIPNFVGVAGTTPSTLKTGFSDPRLKLNKLRVPQSLRRLVFDPDAEAELGNLDVLTKVNESGSTQGLREASMGRVKGFDTYMDQNIYTHQAGEYTTLTDVTVTGISHDPENSKVSVLTLTSAAGAATTSLKAGDLLTVDGHQYVVVNDTSAAVSGVISGARVSSKFHVDTVGELDSANVTFPDNSAGGHVSNLAFHQNAITLVTAPLAIPQGAANAYTAIDPDTGLSLRVVWGYDMTEKKEMLSVDCLFGTKTIFPELACQVLG